MSEEKETRAAGHLKIEDHPFFGEDEKGDDNPDGLDPFWHLKKDDDDFGDEEVDD